MCDAGAISLDQSVYSCQDVVGISLVDSDLSGVGTYVVSISSGIEPTPENVTLTENPPGSGQFSGTFPTTAAPSVNGDGAISVANADTITVTRNEILYSLNKPDDFILALVEFRADGGHDVRYLRQPFQREPDFGVTSVNYDFGELLSRATTPT